MFTLCCYITFPVGLDIQAHVHRQKRCSRGMHRKMHCNNKYFHNAAAVMGSLVRILWRLHSTCTHPAEEWPDCPFMQASQLRRWSALFGLTGTIDRMSVYQWPYLPNTVAVYDAQEILLFITPKREFWAEKSTQSTLCSTVCCHVQNLCCNDVTSHMPQRISLELTRGISDAISSRVHFNKLFSTMSTPWRCAATT